MSLLIPTLETTRLSLRQMKETDIDEFVKVFADPKVMDSFDFASFDRQNIEQWVHRNLDRQETYGFGLFSVILKSSQLLIGDCGLEPMEIAGAQIVELGYEFSSHYWNQGYGTEAAAAVRDFAFDKLYLPELTSLVRKDNMAAKRVSEKIGMTLRGEIILKSKRYWQFSIRRDRLDSQGRIC